MVTPATKQDVAAYLQVLPKVSEQRGDRSFIMRHATTQARFRGGTCAN